MESNSTADCPEFVQGLIAVLAHLPGIALLVDDTGRVLYGNRGFQAESAGRPGDAVPQPEFTVPQQILADSFGTDQTGYHALDLPSGRRTGVSCLQLRDTTSGRRFVMIREDGRQAIVARFATAQEGLLRSRMERDRALASEQRLRAEAKHWRLVSMSDRLTGLLNAAGFHDRAAAAITSGSMGTLVYADLNGFKLINDTLGHAAGDKLLAEIGHSLSSVTRAGDVIGRLGGDEFAIYLTNCPTGDLPKVVERLRKVMTRRIPVNFGPKRGAQILSISPAIGTAIYPEEEADLDGLIDLADARMYEDKARIKGLRQEA